MNQWRLRTKLGLYVTLGARAAAKFTANQDEALVFDERDNEVMKRNWYEQLLGQPLEVEPCAS
jgi:hypothetical protein